MEDPLQRLDASAETCALWDREHSATATHAAWAAPTFIAIGRYSTYETPESLRAAVDVIPAAEIVEDPGAGGGVLARTEWTLAARDRWLENPDLPPGTGCLTSLTPSRE
ncbi:MAG TPA: hypothetical protein VLA55_05075 [Ornithinibacter sp.]|nr:hypothetical protein [Ornithinibacter sp.]